MEKYRKATFILMLSIIIFTAVFAGTKFFGKNTADKNFNSNIEASESKNSVMDKPKTSDETASHKDSKNENFLLIIEGNSVCAYHIVNGEKNLIESVKIETSIIDPKELDCLKRGIYAESYEDLCLYFEAYSS